MVGWLSLIPSTSGSRVLPGCVFFWSALTGLNKYQTGTASQPNTDWLGVGSSGYGDPLTRDHLKLQADTNSVLLMVTHKIFDAVIS